MLHGVRISRTLDKERILMMIKEKFCLSPHKPALLVLLLELPQGGDSNG